MNKTLEASDYHEMSDRLYLVADMLERYCTEHPVAQSDLRIRSLLEKATEDIYDAYQIAGSLMHENR